MFCTNCGAENESGAKFCKSCGQSITAEEGVISKNSSLQVDGLMDKIKKVPKKFIVIGFVAIICLIILLGMMESKGKTIKLNDYLLINVSRYDGHGKASVEVDWTAIEEKYGDDIEFTKQAKEEIGEYAGFFSIIDLLEGSVDIELDKMNSLSNGDVVNYIWKIDEEYAEYIDCKMIFEDSSFVVSGLEKIDTFDAFEGVEVSFSGIAPYGKARITETPYDNGLTYSIENADGLKNGDIVTVKVSFGWYTDEEYIEKFSVLPEMMSKEYVVDGLEERVETYSEIPSTLLEEMKAEAEEFILESSERSPMFGGIIHDLEYAGYVFGYPIKMNGLQEIYNHLNIFYKAKASSFGDIETIYETYIPVQFHNMIKSGSDVSYEKCAGIIKNSRVGTEGYQIFGYTNPYVCYNELVESKEENYVKECGDGIEVYAEYENVTDIASIDADFMKILEEDALVVINDYVESWFTRDSHCNDIEYKGKYLLLDKEQDSTFGDKNSLIVIYSATISNDKGKYDTTSVYFPVKYNGIYKLPTGEWKYTTRVGILGNSVMSNPSYTTFGYLTEEKMFENVVEEYEDEYTYKMTEGMKEF